MENRAVARHMHKYFKRLTAEERSDPVLAARKYANSLINANDYCSAEQRPPLAHLARFKKYPYHIGLETTGREFATLTKRATLVSDTLLLSHGTEGDYRRLGWISDSRWRDQSERDPREIDDWDGPSTRVPPFDPGNPGLHEKEWGFYCPSLESLGTWLLESEPLLRAGLAWHLPTFMVRYQPEDCPESTGPSQYLLSARDYDAVDFLVTDGRAVNLTDTKPVLNRLVRPILEVDIPMLEGVGLRDFARITVEEFDSYAATRDLIRRTLLDMDSAMDDVQSDIALAKLGIDIRDGVREVQAQMSQVARHRAVRASGAGLGSVAAVLVAVYGPALTAVVSALGVGGMGVWQVLQASADHDTRSLRKREWYFVWALSKKSYRA
ncbi:hypothetical protein AB0A77_37315 [Streptomyces varsoviensis]|uniref:hypothetical protein n=1 Tax=Streptomyces varsoviensis TaxID=67373 RepID=UPI0033E6EB1F